MRHFKSALAAAVAIGALAAAAHAGDKLRQGPAPDWVEPVALPKTASAPEGAPVAVLVSDVQARFTPQASAFYTEAALRIQTAQGLTAGQFALAWDPAFASAADPSGRAVKGVHQQALDGAAA